MSDKKNVTTPTKKMSRENLIKQVDKRNLSLLVFENIKDLIEERHFEADEKLYSETRLAKMFNVSRSTVREAIKRLNALNLIYTVPGVGSFVSKDQEFSFLSISQSNIQKQRKNILDLLELRLALEPHFVSIVAEISEKNDLYEIKKVVGVLNTSDGWSEESYMECDLNLHLAIAKASKNDYYIKSLKTYIKLLQEQEELLGTIYLKNFQRLNRFHNEILVAIENRDSKLAASVMENHLIDTINILKNILK
jgi:GntR family transcriptional repressor for pyruvate dehydrogenase complex